MAEITPNVGKTGFFSRLWQGFLKTVGTKEFYRIFAPWVKYLAVIAALLLAIGAIWGLACYQSIHRGASHPIAFFDPA